MDIEEKMIHFIMNEANEDQIQQFFGYAAHNDTKEDCEDNLAQMPDEVFDELVEAFGINPDVAS